MPAKISSQYIKDSFVQEGYVVSNIDRVGGRCVVEYVCPNNHRHSIRWDHWKNGQRCAYCFGNVKHSIDFIKRLLKKEGYGLLDVKYVNGKYKLLYICPKGHKHSTRLDIWKAGHRCPYCTGWKLFYEFVKQEFEKKGYNLLTKEYRNAHQKLDYICPSGHGGSISWHKWLFGQRCLICSNTSVSIRQVGFGNSNWKGGISCEPYCDAWLDKDFKESIKERDNYVCQNPDCWRKDGYASELTIHHIDYNKKNCNPQNLITLCRSCNSRANIDREWHMEWYQIIMSKRYKYNCK